LTGGDSAVEADAETDAGDIGDCGGGDASAEDNRDEPILPPLLIASLFISL
jgi:hypothetical protein